MTNCLWYNFCIMVRLSNKENKKRLSDIAWKVMHLQEFFTHIVEINNKELKPCIYAMWHMHQFCVYGVEDKANLSIMISNSDDGEIIANVVEKMGFKTVRGSSNRKGCISGTMQMVERLKAGECGAIMVDGPRGPLRKVKNGIIKIAKLTNAPIVPVVWYCPQFNFVKLPSWDRMSTPIGSCKIVNLYGEPIYVDPSRNDEEYDNELKEKIRSSLIDLEERIPDVYKEAKKNKLWKKLKKRNLKLQLFK